MTASRRPAIERAGYHLEEVFLSESDQGGRRCNPYRVKDGFGDGTQGSARGGRNPGLDYLTPLGLARLCGRDLDSEF